MTDPTPGQFTAHFPEDATGTSLPGLHHSGPSDVSTPIAFQLPRSVDHPYRDGVEEAELHGKFEFLQAEEEEAPDEPPVPTKANGDKVPEDPKVKELNEGTKGGAEIPPGARGIEGPGTPEGTKTTWVKVGDQKTDGVRVRAGGWRLGAPGQVTVTANTIWPGVRLWFGVSGPPNTVYVWVQLVKETVTVFSESAPKGAPIKPKDQEGSKHRGKWGYDKGKKFYPVQAGDPKAGTSMMSDQPNLADTNVPQSKEGIKTLLDSLDDHYDIPEEFTKIVVHTEYKTYLVDLTNERVVGRWEWSYTITIEPDAKPPIKGKTGGPTWVRGK